MIKVGLSSLPFQKLEVSYSQRKGIPISSFTSSDFQSGDWTFREVQRQERLDCRPRWRRPGSPIPRFVPSPPTRSLCWGRRARVRRQDRADSRNSRFVTRRTCKSITRRSARASCANSAEIPILATPARLLWEETVKPWRPKTCRGHCALRRTIAHFLRALQGRTHLIRTKRVFTSLTSDGHC
jgi:hypothetical protein